MQLNYDDLLPSVEGGLGDAGHHDIVSRFSSSIVLFGQGLAVVGPDESAQPSATGFVFEGVALKVNLPLNNATGLAQYDANKAISVLRKGRVWVKSESIITNIITNGVFLRHTVNGALIPGQFRIDADTARADQITTARWLTTTAAINQLALLEFNIPS